MTELSEFKGRYNGTIFLIGNGPSLRFLTPAQKAKLESSFTFVGSRFFEWDEPGFTPRFYILTERKQTTEWMASGAYQKARASIARFWVTWQPAPSGWVGVPRPPSNAHDVLNYGTGGLLGQCQDGVDGLHLHHGKDTPLAMLQVARYMGFSRFYLIGCETTTVGEIYQPNRARNTHAPGIMLPYYARAAAGSDLTDCTQGPAHTLSQNGGPLRHRELQEVLLLP